MTRLQFYRALQQKWIKPFLLPLFFARKEFGTGDSTQESEDTKSSANVLSAKGRVDGPQQVPVPRFWLHAASAGELESLWPIAIQIFQNKGNLILTVFSESAQSSLMRLRDELLCIKHSDSLPNEILYCGYSPWEGFWGEAFRLFRPNHFVTAKYEAWPELWCSLAEQNIPLTVIGAQARTSLKMAKAACALLGSPLPRLNLIATDEDERVSLKSLFPVAQIQCAPDPRWDRIHARAKQGHPRARALTQEFSNRPRPWGILAQVWSSDLRAWAPLLKDFSKTHRPGTLWVVPHRLDEKMVSEMKLFLRQLNLDPASTVFIAEAGFLLELYAAVDWAYVGGGFGASVHNTMEPSLFGLPIAIGPKGENRFSEIKFLKKAGQLTVVHDAPSIQKWFDQLSAVTPEARQCWKENARAQCGGTQKILSSLPLEMSEKPC